MNLNMLSKSYIARCAQLAMILEVSATPKPGNVDRDHDYKDTIYEHFLASAVGVYPILEQACYKEKGIGYFIKNAVFESSKWQKGGNTHFGAFLLLIPLCMAGGNIEIAEKIIKNSSVQDAIDLYKAFSYTQVRVKERKVLDVTDPNSIFQLKSLNITFYDLMKISADYDMIAQELVNGFPISEKCANRIMEKVQNGTNINDAIVFTFIETLSENPDTFIQTKFNKEKAIEVSMLANKNIKAIRKFDEKLIKEKINPGSTADIIIAGLFMALLKGLKV